MGSDPTHSVTQAPYRAQAELPVRVDTSLAVPSPARYRVRRKSRERVHQLVLRPSGVLIAALAVAPLVASGAMALTPALALAAVVGYGPLLAWVLRRRRLSFELMRGNEEATALFSSGRIEEASREYDRLADRASGVPFWHALLVFNRGAAHLRRGEIDRAIELFTVVEDSGWFDDARLGLEPMLHAGLGTAHAIRGAIDEAERCQKLGHQRVSPARRGVFLVLDVLVLLRRGRFRDAASEVDARAIEGEGVLNAAQQRSLQVLKAFALTHASGDTAAVTRAVEAARLGRVGEHDYLAVQWPELRGFLTTHALTAPLSPSGS